MKRTIFVGVCLLAAAALCPASAFGQGMSGLRPSSGGGGTAAGDISVGNGSGLPSTGSIGQIDSSASYIAGNRDAGDFVGRSAEAASNFVGRAASTGASTGTAGISRRGRNSQFTGSRNNNTKSEIRARIVVNFASPARDFDVRANRLASRIEKSSRIANNSAIEVDIADGVVTLRGAVKNDHDRVLAERLALLEGGVRDVVNELTVTTITPLPPTSER